MILSSAHQKIVLNLTNPDRITAVIPTAKKFTYQGRTLIAVPHRITETRLLRNLGINAPSPIKHYYPWSGSYTPFNAQRDTAEFLSLNWRAFCLNDMGCVDAATEYLTPTGWRYMDDYSGGQVAQYHPETEQIEFVTPTEYVKKPCTEMLRIKTKYGVDQLLSPEHRMLIRDRTRHEKFEVVQAADLYQRQQDWLAGLKHVKSSASIAWSSASIPVTFKGCGGAGLALTEAQLRLQVAVIADGHIPSKTSRCTLRLKKSRKIKRLMALLQAAGIEYKQSFIATTGYSVTTFNAPLRCKVFDTAWWAASVEQLQIICDECMNWDGSISADKPSQRFSTFIKESADFIQYAFSACGLTARLTIHERERRGRFETEYTVQVRDNGKPLQILGTDSAGVKHSAMSWAVSPDGYKYCFVVPSTFLILRRNGCIFASGNTGKTLSVLWAFDYLRREGLLNKMLVTAPLSTLERTWGDEIFRHFPHLNFVTLYGPKDRRRKLLSTDADIYLVNHDGIKVIQQELITKKDIDLVVADEIGEFRNAGTDRWKALHKIIEGRKAVWGLTGTPIPNEPTDAWAQAKLICPENVPIYFGKWRDTVMRQMTQFKYVARENATELVYEALQPSIRFSRADCVDLPPCLYQERSVELTPEQKLAYADMCTKLAMEYQGGLVTAVNEAVKCQKLVQIACGVVYNTDSPHVYLPVKPRLELTRDIIREAGTKTIVFVPFKGVLDYVARELSTSFSVACISGDVPKNARDQIFAAFQSSPHPQVLVASPAAMSHGLTLTAANTVLWFAPINSNAIFEQANARVSRPGQRQTQFIVMIEGTNVERKMYTRLKNKQHMQGLLLDAVREG